MKDNYFKTLITEISSNKRIELILKEVENKPCSWTYLIKKLNISHTELGRIINFLSENKLIKQNRNKEYSLNDMGKAMSTFRDIALMRIQKYKNNIIPFEQSTTFGISKKEYDEEIKSYLKDIEKITIKICSSVYKKRRKLFREIFNSEIKNINDKIAKNFLNRFKNKIFFNLCFDFYEEKNPKKASQFELESFIISFRLSRILATYQNFKQFNSLNKESKITIINSLSDISKQFKSESVSILCYPVLGSKYQTPLIRIPLEKFIKYQSEMQKFISDNIKI